jgi:DNA-binding transcriptional LysR family regulator
MENDLFRSRVRLRHLDCFVAVAQTQHLGKAAVKLRLTQPAVSKTLTELEEITGTRLLERSRLGARLTREGEAFLAHAVAVLDALDAAKSSIHADQEPSGEALHIGALPTVAPDLLPAVLTQFQAAYPQVRIHVQTATNAQLLQMLKAGEVDVALARMADPAMMAGLSFELLYVEPLVFAVRPGHPLLEAAQVSLTDIVAHPLIVSPRGTVPRHNTESFLQSRGLKFPVNCVETLSLPLARRLTQQANFVWITPAGAVRANLESDHLVQLPIATLGTEEPVGLMRRSEGASGRMALAFMTLLREMAVKRRSGEV